MKQKGSVSFSVRPASDDHRRLIALINEVEDARLSGDQKAFEAASKKLFEALDKYDPSGHANPEWHLTTLKAVALAAAGRLLEAVSVQSEGVAQAKGDRESALTMNNLSDFHRKLGDIDQALEYATAAYRLLGTNEGVLLNLALALARAGEAVRAIAIIEKLATISDSTPRSILELHLRYEEELQDFLRSPAVQACLNEEEGTDA